MSDYVLSDGSTLRMPLPCIVCGCKLDGALPPSDDGTVGYNQPHAGTAFTTHGHYGSTVFDPMNDREALEITVCDACLKTHARLGHVIYTKVTPQRPKRKVRKWNG